MGVKHVLLNKVLSEGKKKKKYKKQPTDSGLCHVTLLCMALSSVRIFLKDGLFLGSYCQQLFIIRATSEGQWCGGGIRYPKKQRTGISEKMLTPKHVPAFPLRYL